MSWETVKLGDVAKLVTGKTPSTSITEYFDGDVLWVTPVDFKSKYISETSRTLTQKAIDDKKCNMIPANSVVLNCIGEVGKVSILRETGATNQQITSLIPTVKVSTDFLYYSLLISKSALNNLANKAVVPILNNERLKTLSITLPHIDEQKIITKILDKADNLRKKDKQLLQYYDDLAQSLFIDMVGDPVRNEKGWPQKSLGNACIKITDGTHFSPPSQASGVPYITAKHVRKNKVDFFNNPTYVTQEDHEAIYSRCTPVKGDVLYIKDGATTGIAAINNYDFEFSMLSSLALIKVNKQVLNNYFLAHWLNNENIKENYIRNYMAGAAIRRFTLDKIKRFEILIPPITLQNKFAEQIQNIEQQKEKLKVQMQESENLFQALLQKAFNGGLN